MDCDDRKSPASIISKLLEKPSEFSFFQAIRLLRLHSQSCTGKKLEAFYRDHLRVRPQLSLGFPATDLTEIEEEKHEDGDMYRLEATFLGLYGASSPLPVFYTEELLSEAADDKSVTRDFVDIINNDAYAHFFRGWTRSRLMIKAVDEQDYAWLERLYSLLGYGHKVMMNSVPEECRRFRHIGLFTQYPRSALGCARFLRILWSTTMWKWSSVCCVRSSCPKISFFHWAWIPTSLVSVPGLVMSLRTVPAN